MRDRLRVGMGGLVREARPGLLDPIAAKAKRGVPLLADDGPLGLLTLSAGLLGKRERASDDLGVERAGQAAIARVRSAYGRIASMRASARRSFAAATSSIAFVILRVLPTERSRRLMSWTVATFYSAAAPTSPVSSFTANVSLNFFNCSCSRSSSSSDSSFFSRSSL